MTSKTLALNGLLLLAGMLLGGLLLIPAHADSPQQGATEQWLCMVCVTVTPRPFPSATLTPSASPSPTKTTIPLATFTPSPSPTIHDIFKTATQLATNFPIPNTPIRGTPNTPTIDSFTEVPPTPIGTNDYLIIAPNGLNIRRTASINGVIVGKINAGSRVAIADKIVDSVNMIVWGRLGDGRGYVALSQDGFIYAAKQ